MADKSDILFNKLLTGQNKLEADVDELKTDVAILKTDVAVLKTDVAELKTDVAELKTDVAILKTDVSELKEGQRRTELFLMNMENRIVPIINATFEGMKVLTEQMATFQETQVEHSERIENHELRILKLENTK